MPAYYHIRNSTIIWSLAWAICSTATSLFAKAEPFSFDLISFVIILAFGVTALISEWFLLSFFKTRSPDIAKSRMQVLLVLDELDKKGLWPNLIKEAKEARARRCWYIAKELYRKKTFDFRHRCLLAGKEFAEAFRSNNLEQALAKERIPLFRKRKILRLEKNQDKECFYTGLFNRYKAGCIGLSNQGILINGLLPFLLSVGGLVLSIVFSVNIEVPANWWVRLLGLAFLAISEVVLFACDCKTEIAYEQAVEEMIVSHVKGILTNQLASFHEEPFYSELKTVMNCRA